MTAQVNAVAVPEYFKSRVQWVTHKGKRPFAVKTGQLAHWKDRTEWAPFDEAVRACGARAHDGVGYVIADDEGLTFIDIDHCVTDGVLNDEARHYVEFCETYAEISPSGNGVHILGFAEIDASHKQGDYEIYGSGRYFTVTGWHIDGVPSAPQPCQKGADEFCKRFTQVKPSIVVTSRLTDEQVIEKALAAKNGDKFRRLYVDGDTSGYPSHSEAELAEISMLKFYTGGDDLQADRLHRRSALMRSKWDEKRGAQTYGERTLSRATVSDVYASNGEQIIRDDERFAKAMAILTDGDPIDYILTTYNSQHVGDRALGEGLLLGTAAQSVLNSLGVPSKLTGGSGKGKSHAARAIMHMHPQNYVLYASLTDKAAWYLDILTPGMTIFSDDVSISPDLEGIIKRSTSNFQRDTTRFMPSRDRNGKTSSVEQKIPARLNWILTSVNTQGTEELIKRQMGYDVDTSEAQDKAYIEFEKRRAAKAVEEFPETEDVLTCREIIRILKENEDGSPRLIGVDIPFADRIAWTDTENRRNFNIFMDMVRSYALLRFMQRGRCVEGNIIATVDDFNDAKRHYGARAGMQALHLDEQQKRFCQHLAEEGGEADTATMQARMKRSRQVIYRIADSLEAIYWRFSSETRWIESGDAASKRTQKRFYILNYDGGAAFTLDEYSSVVYLKDEKEDF